MTTPEMKSSEFMTVRGGMGNDAFAATQNLVNVARAMFANEGIDLKTVEEFRCSVKRNHDADELGGDPIAMWDTFAEVTYLAPAEAECKHEFTTLRVGHVAGYSTAPGAVVCTHCGEPRDDGNDGG